jgi:hypothetical protein
LSIEAQTSGDHPDGSHVLLLSSSPDGAVNDVSIASTG